MLIDRSLVAHMARLASLEHPKKSGEHAYDDASLDALASELQKILDYVEEISTLKVDDVPPTRHGVPAIVRFREDEAIPATTADLALQNAPAREGDHLLVPRVIGEP